MWNCSDVMDYKKFLYRQHGETDEARGLCGSSESNIHIPGIIFSYNNSFFLKNFLSQLFALSDFQVHNSTGFSDGDFRSVVEPLSLSMFFIYQINYEYNQLIKV